MEKSHLEMLKEELALARQGKIKYEPDPPTIVIRDPKNFEKRQNALRRLNGLPPQKITIDANGNIVRQSLAPEIRTEEGRRARARAGKAVVNKSAERMARGSKSVKSIEINIPVSQSTYSRLAKKAKRAKMDVPSFLEKLAGE